MPLGHLYIFLGEMSIYVFCPFFNWINHSKIFFDPPPRVMEIKTKINKWGLIKLKIFCTAKETINKTKRQSSEWEKIFANETTKD